MASSGYKVAVVGASGLKGGELIDILAERNFPIRQLVALGTRDSERGDEVEFRGNSIGVQALGPESFAGVEIAFFMANDRISAEYVPLARSMGGLAIDTSTCYRLQEDVPLILPEINARHIDTHDGLIAVPGPATIQLLLPLAPLHRKAGLKRIIVSTYQAVSDDGTRAMDELTEQIRELFSFQEPTVDVYPHQIAFTALPRVGDFRDDGFTSHESMLAGEIRKILEAPEIGVCATMVRVPVYYGHSAAVHVETATALGPEEVRQLLRATPGVTIEDDAPHDIYPLNIYAAGRDECFVGRIRRDPASTNGLAMWIVADNVRKGCALSAVQVAELLIQG